MATTERKYELAFQIDALEFEHLYGPMAAYTVIIDRETLLLKFPDPVKCEVISAEINSCN